MWEHQPSDPDTDIHFGGPPAAAFSPSPLFSSLLALSAITGLPTSCRVSLLLPWVLPHVGDRDPAPVPHVEQLLVADVRLVVTWLALMG